MFPITLASGAKQSLPKKRLLRCSGSSQGQNQSPTTFAWDDSLPFEPVLARLDPLLQTPIRLSTEEFTDLVDFVRYGLLDPHILPERMKTLVPKRVPSGRPTLDFEFE